MTDPKDPQAELFKAIEQLFLERIYLIDQINHFGLGDTEDERAAFVLLGVPNKLITELAKLFQAHQQELLTGLEKELGLDVESFGAIPVERVTEILERKI